MRRFSRHSRKVTIEEGSESQDAIGGVTLTWSTLASVWANRRNLRAREREVADQRLAEAEGVFTIRHSSDVSGVKPENHRLLQAGVYFDILGVVELPGDRPQTMELYVKRADVPAGALTLQTTGGVTLTTTDGEELRTTGG